MADQISHNDDNELGLYSQQQSQPHSGYHSRFPSHGQPVTPTGPHIIPPHSLLSSPSPPNPSTAATTDLNRILNTHNTGRPTGSSTSSRLPVLSPITAPLLTTRSSSAREAASRAAAAQPSSDLSLTSPNSTTNDITITANTTSTPTSNAAATAGELQQLPHSAHQPLSSARKRKSLNPDTSAKPLLSSPTASRQNKRRRATADGQHQNSTSNIPSSPSSRFHQRSSRSAAMASQDRDHEDDVTMSSPTATPSRRYSRNKNKRTARDLQERTSTSTSPSSQPPSKEAAVSSDQDTAMTGIDGSARSQSLDEHDHDDDSEEHEEGEDEENHHRHHRYDDDDEEEDDDDDPFSEYGNASLSQTLRALTGMMASGMSSRIREIINSLRQGEEIMQHTALQELSQILLVSSEDNLQSQFSPDALVHELVKLMQPESSPEIMLLACRCLANLMEAMPGSVGNVVYGGAVPVLCSKLLEISFIDVAEQSLSTLEKISQEYPAVIVREGGLTACLSYLDFFATSTQRTAVTTAANCCRNIPQDSFSVVRDCMPKLLDVLSSSDQRVVEQASLCVSGIVESFKYDPDKLEELVTVDLLRAVLRLLVPGTTNLISSSIHTQFLRVLSHTARASPLLSAELFKLNIVETLYQVLTGISPPADTDGVAAKLDGIVIMQALIHRPREQIMEALNVICELLPKKSSESRDGFVQYFNLGISGSADAAKNDKRIKLLKECQPAVRRFALILFPTLTDAFASTVNLNVRQRVMMAHIKMLSNLDKAILLETLSSVSYASFLASIFSQQDHHTLVRMALESSELLLSRLGDVYRYQLYREGVIAEITKLANTNVEVEVEEADVAEPAPQGCSDHSDASEDEFLPAEEEFDEEAKSQADGQEGEASGPEVASSGNETSEEDDHENDSEAEGSDNDIDHDHEENIDIDDDGLSSHSSRESSASLNLNDDLVSQAEIRSLAKEFLKNHETEKQSKQMKKKAAKILNSLADLSTELEAFFLRRNAADLSPEAGRELFVRLANYFDGDVLESVTSAEILASGLIKVLLNIFSNPDENLARDSQATFLEIFMDNTLNPKSKALSTPFSCMVHKLQDVLSRSEHFDVVTVQNGLFEGGRSSSASFLAKQIKLKLVADDDSNVPKPYRNMMVSIHAIASFQSLADYLRPRIEMSNLGDLSGRYATLTQALAAIKNSGTLTSAEANQLVARLGEAMNPGFPSNPLPPPPGSIPKRHRWENSGQAPSTPDIASGSKGKARQNSHRSTDSLQPSATSPQHSQESRDPFDCEEENHEPDNEDDAVSETPARNMDSSALNEETPDRSHIDLEFSLLSGVLDGSRTSPGTNSHPRDEETSSGGTSTNPPNDDAGLAQLAAAAVVPPESSEWHIEFLVDGKPITNDVTVFRAIYNINSNEDTHGHNVWSTVHQIKYRKVPGPAPTESPPARSSSVDSHLDNSGTVAIPTSLTQHPVTASVLRLLRILHDLNANIEDVMTDNTNILRLNVEPLTHFVNTKLTAKLNRQLEEPLIVASNCLPSWVEDLARCYPFLFPFETRHLFVQSTSFGYARSMARWQNSQPSDDRRSRDERQFLGRLQRQKVRIGRAKIFESALKVMNLYGAGQSILEVEYFEEVGTGLGPTLEFYATISREFAKKKLKLWRETDSPDDEYVNGSTGLFPRPMSDAEADTPNGRRILHMFAMLGKFVARSMLDSRLIDINFNPKFFRIGDGPMTAGVRPSLGAVKSVDPDLARSLKLIKKFALAKKEIEEDATRSAAQKVDDLEKITINGCHIDDLCLDFTLPGFPDVELIPNGDQTRVTIDNVENYLDSMIHMTLGSGVRRQIDSFRAGFTTVFPYSALNAFTPDELVSLFGRVDEDWSLETLMDSIKADHGFNMDSRSIRNLLQLMSNLNVSERRDFLQFTTGSPKLPIGGFKALKPMFTVVCRPSEAPNTPDDYLPSVMTCVNYLKLPDYSDMETMRKQLMTAIKEGQGAFHLS
ncbi:E3 ubiquitin-protein ligase TRIP12 [Ceratocystis fimbriata CBS 114723]|uniref:HECT-type E3 ubiquitin transferase n=1 Tax=Ceratocystis fimbriata CBS 114723 TaxID=1035309 RepID=A0A2C5XBB0_9PEZI|nr:E3 ubiquitin-protein ligase TRIP12 [Ceratocystis fimbriata CBS 114723]